MADAGFLVQCGPAGGASPVGRGAGCSSWFCGLSGLLPEALRYVNPGDKLHKLAGVLPARSAEEMYQGLVSFWKQAERNPALRQSSCLTWWIEKVLKQLRDPQISEATGERRKDARRREVRDNAGPQTPQINGRKKAQKSQR
jgi:hypothetical protein